MSSSPAAPPAIAWKPSGMSGTIASKGKHMVRATYPCGVRTASTAERRRRQAPGHRGRAALVRPRRAGRRGSTGSRTSAQLGTTGRWKARGAVGISPPAGRGLVDGAGHALRAPARADAGDRGRAGARASSGCASRPTACGRGSRVEPEPCEPKAPLAAGAAAGGCGAGSSRRAQLGSATLAALLVAELAAERESPR